MSRRVTGFSLSSRAVGVRRAIGYVPQAVIAFFPPVAVNLLAAISKMPRRIFLFYNFTGSAAYTISYILNGYFFGRKWKLLEAWLGPTVLYLILAGIALIVLGVIFRHSLSGFFALRFFKRRKRQL